MHNSKFQTTRTHFLYYAPSSSLLCPSSFTGCKFTIQFLSLTNSLTSLLGKLRFSLWFQNPYRNCSIEYQQSKAITTIKVHSPPKQVRNLGRLNNKLNAIPCTWTFKHFLITVSAAMFEAFSFFIKLKITSSSRWLGLLVLKVEKIACSLLYRG